MSFVLGKLTGKGGKELENQTFGVEIIQRYFHQLLHLPTHLNVLPPAVPFIGTIPSGSMEFCIDGGERASLHDPRAAQDCAFYSGGFADHNDRTTRCGKLQVFHLTGFVHLLLNL